MVGGVLEGVWRDVVLVGDLLVEFGFFVSFGLPVFPGFLVSFGLPVFPGFLVSFGLPVFPGFLVGFGFGFPWSPGFPGLPGLPLGKGAGKGARARMPLFLTSRALLSKGSAKVEGTNARIAIASAAERRILML